MQASKSIFASKTFWVNAITIVLAIIAITDPQAIHMNSAYLLWISGVLNIFLRFLTNQPVANSPR